MRFEINLSGGNSERQRPWICWSVADRWATHRAREGAIEWNWGSFWTRRRRSTSPSSGYAGEIAWRDRLHGELKSLYSRA